MTQKIAVISASWNTEIVQSAENSFVESMMEKGFAKSQIDIIKVPGSLEIQEERCLFLMP